MSGLYIHIPFCRQACTYCDFHFSTSLKQEDEMVHAILTEIRRRKSEIDEPLQSIYFGGGTPGILKEHNINSLMTVIYDLFQLVPHAEITLEANPEDISINKLMCWKDLGINRLSIGVQSFQDHHLKWMNRAHDASTAQKSIELSRDYGFQSLNLDLIYGIPGMTRDEWDRNVDQFLRLNVEHLSAYCLTKEPKTAFAHQVSKGLVQDVDDEQAVYELNRLQEKMEGSKWERYEISNFAFDGNRAVHNTNYWKGKKYLGVGPSAHSFNGENRSWNVANNPIYINSTNAGQTIHEVEELNHQQRFNEKLLTGLRTKWGLDLSSITGEERDYLLVERKADIEQFQRSEWLVVDSNSLKLTKLGWLYADYIAGELFREV